MGEYFRLFSRDPHTPSYRTSEAMATSPDNRQRWTRTARCDRITESPARDGPMSASNKATRTHIRAGADATGDYRALLEATADGGTVGSTRVAADAESTSTSELGTINDRYKIGAEIARGGMGIVYSARDLAFERDVAVKTVRGDRTWSESTVERFSSNPASPAGFSTLASRPFTIWASCLTDARSS